jgi:NADPH2:quinone reductase
VSGVNPSDVKTRAGSRGPLTFQYVIPHSDGAGVIESVGSGVEPARIGQRVWIWNAAWGRPFGSCAEFVCLPESQAVELPEDTDFASGACLGIPAMTACHAVLGDGDVRNMTVLVTGGAGAVGHYAIQFAKWSGARVITTVSGEEKAAHAATAGADHIINYRTQDVTAEIRRITGGEGVERIVEVEFGGNLDTSLQVLKPGGVIAAYGSMAVPTPSLPFYPLMFRHSTVRTILVYILTLAERRRAIQLITSALRENCLKHAIGARFPLQQTGEAHLAVESGRIIGNVIVSID